MDHEVHNRAFSGESTVTAKTRQKLLPEISQINFYGINVLKVYFRQHFFNCLIFMSQTQTGRLVFKYFPRK